MAKYRKWVAGGLGWAMGGPIGALLGFAFGYVFDEMADRGQGNTFSGATRPGDFSASLLVLSAAVMQADGVVVKSELNYVKRYLASHFGEDKAKELLLMLRELLQENIPVIEVCHQVEYNMSYSGKLQLLHYLFGIANADSSGITGDELGLLSRIAEKIGITGADYFSIRAMFIRRNQERTIATEIDYRILGVKKTANETEIKAAYRKMVMKYHPDKVLSLGKDVQKAAKEKFQKVQQAYENIKKERGI